MNELMLCMELVKAFKAIGRAAIPTVTATVQLVQGNVIYLTTTPSTTANAFFGGELAVTSGAASGIRSAIIGSAGNQIVIAGTFSGVYIPVEGDTVTLWGGPLSTAAVFFFEPESVAPQQGVPSPMYVTVNVMASKMVVTNMVKKMFASWFSFRRLYDIEVVVETPKISGTGTDPSSVRKAIMDLYVLKEQVEVVCANFRFQEARRVLGDGDMTSTFVDLQRTGGNWNRGAIIEFTLKMI